MIGSFTIQCVDDEKYNRQILEKLLDDYSCTLLASGKECLDTAIAQPPDLILLDVMMPDMDGLETCRNLRKHPALHYTPVIFLSASNDIGARLEGYTAGGDDYVCKPFDQDELLAKVNATLKRKAILDTTRQEVEKASASVMDIMTTMGEMSAVVHFLQSIYNCKSYASLARKVIQTHENFGLEVAIEIFAGGEKHHFCTAEVENPLEESVFDYIRDKGRLHDFGERTAVNHPRITIIIRNMPVDNQELHGRIRDYIALIAQGADSKILGLESELVVRSQHENLISVMNNIEKAITEIHTDTKNNADVALDEKCAALLSQIQASLENCTIEDEEDVEDIAGEAVSLF